MLNKVKSILHQECNLNTTNKIVVGISGGPDSICLLDILTRLPYFIIAFHLDHGLRLESKDDAKFVKEFTSLKGVDLISKRVDVRSFATRRKLSIEEAARIVRYQHLFATAKEVNAQAVAVGHNADDQVETVLMHLIRGAGLDGLVGLRHKLLPNPWSDTIPLIRPLLSTWRSEIDDYLRGRGLASIYDKSNADTTFFRNRIRHELVPYLDSYIPGLKHRIWNMSSSLKYDLDFINAMVDKAWLESIVDIKNDYVVLDQHRIAELEPSIKGHLFRRLINHIQQHETDINYQIINRISDFIERPTNSSQDEIGMGLWIRLEGDNYILYRVNANLPLSNYPQVSQDYPILLKIPGTLDLSEIWTISAVVHVLDHDSFKNIRNNKDIYTAWLGFDNKPEQIEIRKRLIGDRFVPLGMVGKTISLKNYMINKKIPRRARKNWPIICLNNEIIWIPGYQISDKFQVTSKTKTVLEIKVIKRNKF